MIKVAGRDKDGFAQPFSVTEDGRQIVAGSVVSIEHSSGLTLEPNARYGVGIDIQEELAPASSVDTANHFKMLVTINYDGSSVRENIKSEIIQYTNRGGVDNGIYREMLDDIEKYLVMESGVSNKVSVYEIPIISSNAQFRFKNNSNETQKIRTISIKLV